MMKNKNILIIINELKLDDLKKDTMKFIIDGKDIKTVDDYLEIMTKKFKFPQFDNKLCNFNGYLDWIRDLTWLDEEFDETFEKNIEISLIIKNYKNMFNGNFEDINNIIIEPFVHIILPYWERDILESSFIGTRKFNVYLVENLK